MQCVGRTAVVIRLVTEFGQFLISKLCGDTQILDDLGIRSVIRLVIIILVRRRPRDLQQITNDVGQRFGREPFFEGLRVIG